MAISNDGAFFNNFSGILFLLCRATEDDDSGAVNGILAARAKSTYPFDLDDRVNGRTPLSIACINGSVPIVKLLLKADVDQGLCDLDGWTGKEHAAFRGHLAVAELLSATNTRDYRDLNQQR